MRKVAIGPTAYAGHSQRCDLCILSLRNMKRTADRLSIMERLYDYQLHGRKDHHWP